MNNDIPTLHAYLSGKTRHFFDLSKPLENAAFYNLAQHHGYPTPLLDWTYSPFVAAYFAYRSGRRFDVNDNAPVRIYIFDKQQWRADFIQLQKLSFAKPHFSILESVALENERMSPQQALSSITNVDDIESYIRGRELERHKTYLAAVDLPFIDRTQVLSELSMMGIAAGALFPGLDGICEELRNRNFS